MRNTKIKLDNRIILKILGDQDPEKSRKKIADAGAEVCFVSRGISCGILPYDVYDWENLEAWETPYPIKKIELKQYVKFRIINLQRDYDFIHSAILIRGGDASKEDLIEDVPLPWPTTKLRISNIKKWDRPTVIWVKEKRAKYKIVPEAFYDMG